MSEPDPCLDLTILQRTFEWIVLSFDFVIVVTVVPLVGNFEVIDQCGNRQSYEKDRGNNQGSGYACEEVADDFSVRKNQKPDDTIEPIEKDY